MNGIAPAQCFHCGKSLPEQVAEHAVRVEGIVRPVCCAGCEAAAHMIIAQGLERFYRYRTFPEQPADPMPQGASGHPQGAIPNWAVYDRAQALRQYTHRCGNGDREVSVQIEGMHCAACAWLIETSLKRIDGIVDIQVNPTSARAAVRYDPNRIALSRLLQGIAALNYRPRPLCGGAGDAADTEERRTALRRLAVAGFGMMQVMTYAVSLYAGAMDGIAPNLAQLFRFVSLLVSTPVVLYSAQPFFIAAWRGLRARTLGMDLPVALSIGAAYGWSVWSTLRGSGAVYFDSAVMFTFFLLLGRFVEMSLRHRSGPQQEAMARLLPDSVLRLTEGREERVMPEELIEGDRVRILAGERIPADGEVTSGRTEVDESLLTGESQPKTRSNGAPLIAGTVNLSGVIEMRVTRVGQDSTLAAVSRLLQRAHASRPRIADQADKVAAWFVGGVLLLALIVGIYWLDVDAARAFPTVLAVLVVTCPCALSLATPAALAAGSTRLARSGLLVARARALETLARADCIVFDKTGTLTRGRPRLDEVRVLSSGMTRERCLSLGATLERYSEHPIARAFPAESAAPAAAVADVRLSPGRGIEARVGGAHYRVGSADYVMEIADPAAAGQDAQRSAALDADAGQTVVYLGNSSGLQAAFLLSDTLREDARSTVEQLKLQGLVPLVASGDRAQVVAEVAQRLGGLEARAGLRAADKLALVRELQAEGHIVAMVGDGVNDAPVLAGADVSVAVGGGTLLAKVSADIVLLGDALGPLSAGIDTARRTLGILRQNLTWAVMYNLAAVPMAAVGWLQPWMAAVGMSGSSLLVTMNALRLLRAAPRRAPVRPVGRIRKRAVHA